MRIPFIYGLLENKLVGAASPCPPEKDAQINGRAWKPSPTNTKREPDSDSLFAL